MGGVGDECFSEGDTIKSLRDQCLTAEEEELTSRITKSKKNSGKGIDSMNYELEVRQRLVVGCFHYASRPNFSLASPKVAEVLIPYAEKYRNLL